MHLAHYLDLQHRAATRLADSYRRVSEAHRDEPDLARVCLMLADQCDAWAATLNPYLRRYTAIQTPDPPGQLHTDLFGGPRAGGLGLLRDLHDLFLMATECDLAWTVINQAAFGTRDEGLLAEVGHGSTQTAGQLRWLRTRIRQAAPQALVVAA
jgi:hypothetical protein